MTQTTEKNNTSEESENKDLVELCTILKDGTRASINLYKLRSGLTVEDWDHLYNFYPEDTTKKYLNDFLSVLVLLDLDQSKDVNGHSIYNKYFKNDGNEYYDFLPNKKKLFIDMILNEELKKVIEITDPDPIKEGDYGYQYKDGIIRSTAIKKHGAR